MFITYPTTQSASTSGMNLKRSWLPTAVGVLLLIILSEYASAVPAVETGVRVQENEVNPEGRSSGSDGNWNLVTKTLEDCSEKDLVQCLGIKAVAVMERAARMAEIPLVDGLVLSKSPEFDAVNSRNGRALMTEDDIRNSIEEQPEPSQKTSRLMDLLFDSVARFFRGHVLQFKLPQLSSEDMQRALEEARGKKKMLKMLLPILLGVGAKMMLIVPLGLLFVGFLAFKALIVSKLALLIGAVIAIQKFFGGGSSFGKAGWNNGASSGGWSSGAVGGGGGGWSSGGNAGGWSSGAGSSSAGYYRSFDAHDLAYKAQAPSQ